MILYWKPINKDVEGSQWDYKKQWFVKYLAEISMWAHGLNVLQNNEQNSNIKEWNN